ncbi:MAG TPA: SMI1/KNR4 family protein [Clostridia bacterium]|nr:SMI1/KNR4 family protein [Clostridia bacterium]
MLDDARYDDLIARIRDRAADPERRVDERPSQLWSEMTAASLGGLASMGRSLVQDLFRLSRRGADDEIVARAERLRERMETPADRPLPPPATEAQVAAAEGRYGIAFPPLLRRLYLEVANGGFGPGSGLLGVSGGARSVKGRSMEQLYETMLEARQEHRGWIWPPALIPIVDDDGSFIAVDASTPETRVIEFDFEALDEEGGDGGWSRAFEEKAASLEAWLEGWVGSQSAAERWAAREAEVVATMTTVPEVTRQYWASMTPGQRAEHGLPEKGWGRALFGDAWGDDPRDGSGDG